jgi:uncharacterized membrane protein YbaN (DUF454 family)
MRVQRTSPGRILVSYAGSIVILWLLIEVLWGATAGVIVGLTIARDPGYQQQLEAFFKQRGITATTAGEIKSAIANLSREDRAALDRMTRDALRGSQVAGLGMTLFVSAAAFGIAAFIAGFFAREWRYAWTLLAASAVLNNPLRRFSLLAAMPLSQKVVVVLFAQLLVSFLAAWVGFRIAARRDVWSEPVSANA